MRVKKRRKIHLLRLRALKKRSQSRPRVRSPRREKRMAQMGIHTLRQLAVVPLLLIAIVIAGLMRTVDVREVRFSAGGKAVPMTGSGWAVDAQTDPDAVWPEISLAAVRVTWRELEPEEGVYAFDEMDNVYHLKAWKARGAALILRLMADVPGAEAHRDIPDWLYERMDGAGNSYATQAGAGFTPDFTSETFREAHRALLSAIAEYYGTDYFAYIEVGSLGANGAWRAENGAGMPVMSVALSYLAQYETAFPAAKILLPAAYDAPEAASCGLYLENAGDADAPWQSLNDIRLGGYDAALDVALPAAADRWKNAVIGARLADSLATAQDVIAVREELLAQIRDGHITYISGVPTVDLTAEETAALNEIAAAMGGRLWLRQAKWKQRVRTDGTLRLDTVWVNDGVAPLSGDWRAVLYLVNEDGATWAYRSEVAGFNAARCLPGETRAELSLIVPMGLEPGTYRVGVAFSDPEEGTWLPLNMSEDGNCQIDGVTVLGEVEIFR